MVNDALSAIVAFVDVHQLPINIAVVDIGGTIKLLATPGINSQFTPGINSQYTTTTLFLLLLYCIDSMFILFIRTIAKHDWHVFSSVLENILLKFFSGGKPPHPFPPLHLRIYRVTWQLGSFHCCSTLLSICSIETD